MYPIYYILGTILSCAFIGFGWGGEGYLHYLSLILGGVYLGRLIGVAELKQHWDERGGKQ
jgi:hypothetical protein